MDRAEMINSLAVAMGVKPVAVNPKERKIKYNTNTGTIYCNTKIEPIKDSKGLLKK